MKMYIQARFCNMMNKRNIFIYSYSPEDSRTYLWMQSMNARFKQKRSSLIVPVESRNAIVERQEKCSNSK